MANKEMTVGNNMHANTAAMSNGGKPLIALVQKGREKHKEMVKSSHHQIALHEIKFRLHCGIKVTGFFIDRSDNLVVSAGVNSVIRGLAAA